MFFTGFLGPRGPLVLPLISSSVRVSARPCARISSPPSVPSPLVTPVTLVVVVVHVDHPEGPASCKFYKK